MPLIKVELKLIQALLLPHNEDDCVPTAFIKVSLNGDSSTAHQTAVTDGRTTSPYFRDTFVFETSSTENNTLKFEVFNKDLFSGDTLLCSGTHSVNPKAKRTDDELSVPMDKSGAMLTIKYAVLDEDEVKHLQGMNQEVSASVKQSVSAALDEKTGGSSKPTSARQQSKPTSAREATKKDEASTASAAPAVVDQEQLQKQRKALQAVRSRLMEDEIRKIVLNFAKYDKNNDNTLDAKELEEAVKEAVGGNFSSEAAIEKLVKDMIAAADTDKDGKLTVSEIKGAFLTDTLMFSAPPQTDKSKKNASTPLQRVRSRLMEDEIRKILNNFTKYDKSGDGNLDATELEAAIKDAVGGNFSSEAVVDKLVKDMIEAADSDKDGKISVTEMQGTFFFDEFSQPAFTKKSAPVTTSSSPLATTTPSAAHQPSAPSSKPTSARPASTDKSSQQQQEAAATTTASSNQQQQKEESLSPSPARGKPPINDLSEFPEEKRETLIKCFNIFDVSGDGLLSQGEALAGLLTFYPGVSATKLRRKIIEADKNADGSLDVNEFAKIAYRFV